MADDGENFENIQRIRKHLSSQPLRFVHIFFAVILTLYGTAILLATITVKSELCDYTTFLHYYLDKPVVVLILGSIVLVGIGCLGIISSAQSLYHGIVTFGVLLFGLSMFELTIAAVFLALSNSADKSITEALKAQMNNYTEYTDAMDYIQANLQCCGISDFTDWNTVWKYIPGSCCGSDNQSGCGLADILNLNETGCHKALKDLIFYFIDYLVIILGALVALEITAMVVTFFLVRGMVDYDRQRIAAGSTERSDRGLSDTEASVQARNPLGNASRPLPTDGKLNYEESQPTATGVRGSIIWNPIYRDSNSFNHHGRNQLRHKIVPTAVPRLPRAHRRFPVGY